MQTGGKRKWLISLLACACAYGACASTARAQFPPIAEIDSFPQVPPVHELVPPTETIYHDGTPGEPTEQEQHSPGSLPAIAELPFSLHSVPLPLQRDGQMEGVVKVRAVDQTVSIYARGVDVRVILANLAEESRVNIVVAENVTATVTTTLNNVPLWEALDAMLKVNGLVWTLQDNIIFVTRPGVGGQPVQTSSTSPGQKLQVFELGYTTAKEVLSVVSGLLSASGKAFVHEVDKASTRQTRERIVVEDYPDRLEAIANYLAGVDNPPRQVLIEAHVLQVALDDDQRHGVNLAGLARVAGGRIDVRAQGFANSNASPGFMLGLDGHDLDGMIEALCSNSNVRTLAAPKVLVVNGQEARIQIGSKFGYFVTTTTQTSTLQSVNFLDIGVVLIVNPTITEDGQILLSVQPKVSGGRINPDSGLPEEDTTEASTTVLLPDGKGMIIGGLIKESDDYKKTWVPWLGKQPIIGRLFNRANRDVQRVEVILALTPHIVPFSGMLDCREHASYDAATSASGIITSANPPSLHWESLPTITTTNYEISMDAPPFAPNPP